MTNKTLGQYLKNIRKSFNYTQEFVASQLDISRQAYCHYENDRAIPTNDTIYNLASLYNVSAEMLIELSLQTNNSTFRDEPAPYKAELDSFLEYMDMDNNNERYKNLTNREKHAIYYFNNISTTDQEEVLEIMQMKLRRKNRPI
ncbi:MAG: helix-turn-helix domain-containing protein [Lachnospiraceae bacterium]|nr:helix-turn-helix domain-containing protein [Lachnospiraceae bacterium]